MMMMWGNFGKTRWEDDTMGGDESKRRWLLMMMRIESPFIGDSLNNQRGLVMISILDT